jgi:tRNA(fMet)-specific endonuclease VapC
MAERPKFLLDTNIASYIIRGADATLRAKLQSVRVADVGISAISAGELLYGLARRPGAAALQAAVEAFLKHVQSVPWDADAAAAYGPLRASLEAKGTPLGNLDTLIAAHALAYGAVLVTNDQAFRRVAGLVVADWTAS